MTGDDAWDSHREALRRVCWTICANPSLDIDLPVLCGIAGMTPLHLERAFHLCHGVSIAEYARFEWERRRSQSVARPWLIAAI